MLFLDSIFCGCSSWSKL